MTDTTTCAGCGHIRPEHDQHCPIQELADGHTHASVNQDYDHQWKCILARWDPRRSAALERIWKQFNDAAGYEVSLSDELINDRRRETAAEEQQSTNMGAARNIEDNE